MKTQIIAEVEEILRNKAENDATEMLQFNNNITPNDRWDIEDAVQRLYKEWIDKWNEAIDDEEDGISMSKEFIDLFNEINKIFQIPADSVTYYEQIEIALAVAKTVAKDKFYDLSFDSGFFSEESVSWEIDEDDEKRDYYDVLEVLDFDTLDRYFHSQTRKWLTDFDGVGDDGRCGNDELMDIDETTIHSYIECLQYGDLWTEEMDDITLEEIEKKTGYTLKEYLEDEFEYKPVDECSSERLAAAIRKYINE